MSGVDLSLRTLKMPYSVDTGFLGRSAPPVLLAPGVFRKVDRLRNPCTLSYGMSRQLFKSLGGTFTRRRVHMPMPDGTVQTVVVEEPVLTPQMKLWARLWRATKDRELRTPRRRGFRRNKEYHRDRLAQSHA